MVGVGVTIHAARCCSVSPLSSSSSDQSTTTRQRAEGSLKEILPPLHGGGVFIFFFFFTRSSRAGCFPHVACRCLVGVSTTSSDLDDELLSDGGPTSSWVGWVSTPSD